MTDAGDRDAITMLLHESCRCLDLMDLDSLAACFAEDCVVEYGPGTLMRSEGATALCLAVRRMWRHEATSHHPSNVQVLLDGDTARSIRSVMAWHRRLDGSTATLYGQYHDRHARTARGWRIADRALLMRASEGDFGFSIDPLPRTPPDPGWTPPIAAEVGSPGPTR